VIVGAQWGDEGKGKIVDLLAQNSDVVCRYQGGPNAGHTIVVGDETYKIRALPSGIVRGIPCVIGNGCVVDLEVLIGELDEFPDGEVYLSGNAHLIMPWHLAIDQASERRLGKLAIGTTKRGIGPCYADKAMRLGRVYDSEPFDLETVATQYEGYAQRVRPYVADTSLYVEKALRDGKNVLFEGAQATLLDLDHGTYPFVTSSNPVAAQAAVGLGIGPKRIDRVLGVSKAYVTRVGEGPFPSEIAGDDQVRMRELGGEYGTVTGRERRCGWLDLVALRYAVRVNGMDELALTKLDVLSHFAELPVCVRYRTPDGSETRDFPAHQSDFHAAAPVYETVPGWSEPLDGCASVEDLPAAARAYVDFVEQELGVAVSLVGTGAERASVLSR